MKKTCNFKWVMVITSYFAITLTGCEKSDENVGTIYYSKLYADSTYLEIKGDIREPEIIWGNVETYVRAFRRIERHLVSKNGFISWDFTGAEELKISKNIYDYVLELMEDKNNKLSVNMSRVGISDTISRPHFFDDIVELKALLKNEHNKNMNILTEIAYMTKREGDYPDPQYPNLDDCIIVKYTEFEGDGVGNVCIRGEHGTIQDPKNFWGYICCNACAFVRERPNSCEFNDICGWKRDYYGYDDSLLVIFKVINNMGLPLIALRNCHNYSTGSHIFDKKTKYIDFSTPL